MSDAVFSGQATASGPVMARISCAGQAVQGFDGKVVGKAGDGKLAGLIAGLPAGGPYDIELMIEGDMPICIRDVLVGDVWILAGQSNMQGCGLLVNAAPQQEMVRAFYMDDRWSTAQDPLHNLWDCLDQVHLDLNGGQKHIKPDGVGCGPGVAFAQRMREYTGVPQGVLACAHGGTSMKQWDPKLAGQGGKSLYGAMLRRFRKNGSRVAGVAWYQGESEANGEGAAAYHQLMVELVDAFRRDLNDASLPFAMVQIGRVVTEDMVRPTHWNAVQETQRLLPQTIRRCAVVPAIDLALDDIIHIGSGCNRLGRRLAQAMWSVISGQTVKPIELKSITVETNPRTKLGRVIVRYDNVEGTLQSGANRPVGFTLVDDQVQPVIYDIELGKDSVILHLSCSEADARGMKLHYGLGLDPVCNVTDTADRSLPVMGPIPLGTPRPYTKFPRQIEVSQLQESAGKLEGLEYPKNMAALLFQRRQFSSRFANLHDILGPLAPKDVLVYFRYKLSCREAMKLAGLFGYDGPVKVWIDGRECYRDPHGTNPMIPDAKTFAVDTTAGEHEVLVAMGSNQGAAWGICLRFERTDLTREQLASWQGRYAAPELT